MIKILEFVGVAFAYKKKEEVLKGLNFSIEKGKRAALLGPNGSGKSTSFKIMSTQLRGFTGTVKVAGWDLRHEPVQVRKNLGVCFQSPSLDKILTAQENLLLHGRVLGLDSSYIHNEIKDLAATFRVDYLRSRVENLSGGQARRIEIMKAFLGNPSLLLLDEPTNGLDPQSRRDFWQELSAVSERKSCSVLVTTHLIEEAEICDDLVFIDGGVCMAQGKPAELKASLGFEIILLEISGVAERAQELNTFLLADERLDILGGLIRIATTRPQALFELLRMKWGSDIRRIEWAKPSLADVYFEKTGRAFQ